MSTLVSIFQLIVSFLSIPDTLSFVPITDSNDTLMILRNDYYQVSEDVSLRMDILGNDQISFEQNLMDFSIVREPMHGKLSKGDHFEMLYTPSPDFHGRDSLQYRICHLDGTCKDAWVKILIHAVNDPPIVQDDLDTIPEDQSRYIDVLANDSDDADGKDLHMGQISILQPPGYGNVSIDPLRGILYRPDPNYFGNDMFRYQLCDDGPGQICDSSVVRLHVTPVNDRPILHPDTFSTYHAFPVVIDVLGNDSDQDDQVATLDTSSLQVHDRMDSIPEQASIFVDYSVGLIIFTPPSGFFGPYSFQYSACDRDEIFPLCDTTHVTIHVKDEAPTFH